MEDDSVVGMEFVDEGSRTVVVDVKLFRVAKDEDIGLLEVDEVEGDELVKEREFRAEELIGDELEDTGVVSMAGENEAYPMMVITETPPVKVLTFTPVLQSQLPTAPPLQQNVPWSTSHGKSVFPP